MIPTNAADVAQAARDGALGLIEQVKIGDLFVSALTGLDVPDELYVTHKPIAENFAITDAAVSQQLEMTMDLCLTNPDYSVEAATTAALAGNLENLNETWRDKKKQLYAIMSEREIVTVVTHENAYQNMLISGIYPAFDVNENLDAFFCSVNLVQIILIASEATGGLKDQKEINSGSL